MMKNISKLKIAAILIVCIGVTFYVVRAFISEDRANKISRLGVSYLSGDYRVTYTGFSGDKIWVIQNGKVTSDPAKGYYFFWVRDLKNNNKKYVQVPIANTYIEEIN
ncbi:MAG: hypothetical protein ACJAUP_000292 [Cellvibrionaceae bacterium]|jgi:hypothetical protein